MSTGKVETQHPEVVLVTGVSGFLGGYLATRLTQDPKISRVIAVDAVAPSKDMMRRMGRAEFVRADIRNPLIGKVVRNAEIDTVVHAATASYSPRSGGRVALKEMNVLGAMQLFAACQKSPSVRRVILKSTSEIYGSHAKDPVKFTEEMSARRSPKAGFARDSIDIEGYVRGLSRRRSDIAVTILRFANLIGPRMDTAMSRYLSPPIVPKVAGRDARLQLLHEEDALAALERATRAGIAGTFNIGADGILMVSQAIRRAGRIELPIPAPLFTSVGGLVRGTRVKELTREQIDYLNFGRGIDTTRMRSELGFDPKRTTIQAFDDFIRGRGLNPVVDPHWLDSLEQHMANLAQRWA
ncbi:MAG: SDR family oxidoreductase [Mycobacteriaceae bacterium]